MAQEGIELQPKTGDVWNTAGVARYQAGDHQGAVAALQKSVELRSGGSAHDFFFLAMAHHQLGNKTEARTWYDKAVAWMDKNAPKDEELKRFRAEATELLGVREKK